MRTYLKLAWRNIFRNRRRTFLTGLIIGIGLAAMIFVDAYVVGMKESRNIVTHLHLRSLLDTTPNIDASRINLPAMKQNRASSEDCMTPPFAGPGHGFCNFHVYIMLTSLLQKTADFRQSSVRFL